MKHLKITRKSNSITLMAFMDFIVYLLERYKK